MIAYAHTSLRVLEGWFCVVVLRACVRYSSRCCVPACVPALLCGRGRVGWFGVRVFACVLALLCGRGRVGWFGAPVCVCARVWVCARVVACSRVGMWVCVGGPRLCARPPPGGVLWRFPTLPHPLGCSTIGAAGLSFQVRNVAGRFPGAVTTTRLCRPSPLLLARRRWVAGCPGRRVASWPAVWLGGGWVGRGSYSGCGFFVPPLFVAVSWPVFVGPAGGGGCLVARPPPCWPLVRCLGLGVPGPPLWRCSPFGGVGAGVGGVGVVSAH